MYIAKICYAMKLNLLFLCFDVYLCKFFLLRKNDFFLIVQTKHSKDIWQNFVIDFTFFNKTFFVVNT